MYTHISQKHIDAIRNSASKRNILLIELLVRTGCTASQATSIKTADIGEKSIFIGDTEISLPQDFCSQLHEIAGTTYVFCTRQSPQLTTRRIQQIVQSTLQKAGIQEATPQMLRYTHIKQSIKTQSLEQIAKRLDLCMQRLHVIVGGLQPHIQESESFTLPPSGRDNLVVSVLQHTGATPKQLCDIKVTDVDTQTLTVAGNKHKLPASLVSALHELVNTHNSEYLFCTRQSPQLTVRRVQQIVKKRLKQLDIQKTAQDLRYDWICAHAKQGMQPDAIADAISLSTQRVQEILGIHHGGVL